MLTKLMGAAALCVVMASCAQEDDSNKTAPVRPAPTGSTTELGNVESNPFGLVAHSLVVDLDTPQASTSWGTSACLSVLPADFVLGKAVCATDASKSMVITAAHARQVCSSDATFVPVEPSAGLAIEGCSSLTIDVYVFTPHVATCVSDADATTCPLKSDHGDGGVTPIEP